MMITDPITNNILEDCIGDFMPCTVMGVVDKATAQSVNGRPAVVLRRVDDDGCTHYCQLGLLTEILKVGDVITRHVSTTPTYWTYVTKQQLQQDPKLEGLLRREGSGPDSRRMAPNYAQFHIERATP